TLAKTCKRFDGAGRDKAHASGRQDNAAELRCPALCIGLYGQVERRLDAMHRFDRGGGFRAIRRLPAVVQPLWCVDFERERGKESIALAPDAAEDSICQRLEVAGVAVGRDLVYG